MQSLNHAQTSLCVSLGRGSLPRASARGFFFFMGVSKVVRESTFGFGSLKPLFDASLSLIQQRGWRALAAGRGVHRKGLVRRSHVCSLHARYVEQELEHMEQIPLRILQEVGEPSFLPEYVVSRMQDEADAVAYCWAHRRVKGMGVTEAARYLGMPKSHLSNILNGKKYPPYGKRIELQRLCGNWGIRQWEDRVCGFITKTETPEQREIRRLTEENQQLRMKAA
jgi:hypothetical protein